MLLKVVIYGSYFIIFSFHVMLGIQFNSGRWYSSDETGISAQSSEITSFGDWEDIGLWKVFAVKLSNFFVGAEAQMFKWGSWCLGTSHLEASHVLED